MKIKLILLAFLSFNSLIFAQGSWNIGYLKIKNVTNDDVGKHLE